MANHRPADFLVRTGFGRALRGASAMLAPPSRGFGRLYVTLLAAPWLFVFLDRALQSSSAGPSWTHQFSFWTALVLLTFAGVMTADVLTRRVRQYEATREVERLLFSHARDGLLLVRVLRDAQNLAKPYSFVIAAENPAAVARLAAFGQESSYVGRAIEEVFPDWLRETIHSEYTACATLREVRRYQVSQPDGKLTHESVATPVLDATGVHATHIIVIMRDNAERIQHERELSDALRRAEQANKSKSEFLASMSHELRTPLNAVLGYSEMMHLGLGGKLSDTHKEYTHYIHQSGSHLLKIIGDILDLSKIESGQFVLHDEDTAITPLIDACLIMVKERARGKRLELRVDIAPCLPVLRVDPLRLKQIMLNLLSNAIKFTDHGTVTLTASFDDGRGLVLVVCDTGMGMTPEEMATALEPFGQVESALSRNHGGTGLGLPIARHLVELHGGQLSLASRKGNGTSVSVVIPPDRLVDTKTPDQTSSVVAARALSPASRRLRASRNSFDQS